MYVVNEFLTSLIKYFCFNAKLAFVFVVYVPIVGLMFINDGIIFGKNLALNSLLQQKYMKLIYLWLSFSKSSKSAHLDIA